MVIVFLIVLESMEQFSSSRYLVPDRVNSPNWFQMLKPANGARKRFAEKDNSIG